MINSSNTLFAQCNEVSSTYPSYFLKRSLALDSIEGKWMVARTVKIMKKNRPVNIVKEKEVQTWFVFRNNENFVVCNEKISNQKTQIFFSKSKINPSKYVFNLLYSDDIQSINAFVTFYGKKISFTYSETLKKVKYFFKDKYEDDVSIEYEYELEKQIDYGSVIVDQVPKVKNVILNGLKKYFNI